MPALQHLFSAIPQEDFHIFADCLSSLLNTLRAHNAGQLVLTKILKNLIYKILSLHGLSRDLYLLDFELLLEDLIGTYTSHSSLPVLIKNYLEEHHSEAISPKDIAQRFHISYSHACRIYKQAHGISLTDALTSIRIAYACELLRSSLPISEIASKTGYHDPYYFSRVSKQKTVFFQKGTEKCIFHPLSQRIYKRWIGTGHSILKRRIACEILLTFLSRCNTPFFFPTSRASPHTVPAAPDLSAQTQGYILPEFCEPV